ncbi:hypothetical protein JQ633_33410 [Bradyrhizobium tropiciagri]|uniref:hypothetical protein n=1 Tax=Bradyrhizobium tropiciagri TaxID=312253 RepID=UPI001BACCE39|nr:hypothetical protein [Bradyrhizobium tropiciagri]MBR0875299.1 hypothetical protein [Bradyrhizobium tropiciagri]
MNRTPLIILTILNAAAFSGKGSVIILEYADEAAALRAAQKIAQETGHGVSVRDENARLIGTIPAPAVH